MAKNSIGRDIGKIMKSMDKVSSDTEKVMDILEGMNRNSELGYDGQDALRIIKLLYMTIDEFHHELSFVAKDLKFPRESYENMMKYMSHTGRGY